VPPRSCGRPACPYGRTPWCSSSTTRRLRSSAKASLSPSSPASLAERLGDAYGRVEELVRLPCARDALWGAWWQGAVEAELDTSVALLDLCQHARDAAAAAKRHVRAARRRGGC
jgi:hypothetical protein